MRQRVRIRALVREAGSARVDIDVIDLSATGFRFESVHDFAVGTRVFLSLPTLQSLEAVVIWCSGYHFGCRFVKPLHPAVFETVAKRYA